MLSHLMTEVSLLAQTKINDTQTWLANFQQRYEKCKKKFKVAENIEMAWGVSLSSEYILINNSAYYTGTY